MGNNKIGIRKKFNYKKKTGNSKKKKKRINKKFYCNNQQITMNQKILVMMRNEDRRNAPLRKEEVSKFWKPAKGKQGNIAKVDRMLQKGEQRVSERGKRDK